MKSLHRMFGGASLSQNLPLVSLFPNTRWVAANPETAPADSPAPANGIGQVSMALKSGLTEAPPLVVILAIAGPPQGQVHDGGNDAHPSSAYDEPTPHAVSVEHNRAAVL
jgi:hypothetical protein